MNFKKSIKIKLPTFRGKVSRSIAAATHEGKPWHRTAVSMLSDSESITGSAAADTTNKTVFAILRESSTE